jgi:multiple sugar transport system permease protein
MAVSAASPRAAVVRPVPARRRHSPVRRLETRAAYLFLVPWFLGLFGVTVMPILVSLYLSFTDYNIMSSPRWVGTDNYERLLFDDFRYWQSVTVTLKYVLWSVPLVLIFSLAIAVTLNRGLRGLAIYRSLFYIPSLIGGSVGIGLLWYQVFGQRGIFNDIVEVFGIEPRSWVTNPQWALSTVIWLHVWTFGASMVIFLAALRQIPESYYEAASIDGANGWQRFRRITLPLLTPVIFFNTVLLTIQSFQGFTQAYVVSRGTGGPVDSTLMYTIYLYQNAFQRLNMGYASAMAWLLLLAIAAFTAALFWSARFWVFDADR